MADGLRAFDGAVALVTGAGSGIGQAISEALARRGSHVVVTDVDLDDAERVAAAIRQRGGHASAKHLDVSRFPDFKLVVNETLEQLGRIDYAFNNAGIAITGEAADYTLEAWDRILGVNLLGVVHGVQCVYPAMLRQGFGHIVNTASMAGLTIPPGGMSYTTTKYAVVGLSRALRAEADSRGVRVSVLCPGLIRTPALRGGKHHIFVGPTSEARQRELLRELSERFRPMAASVFADKALDRIARNREIIILPWWWRIFWWLERASPSLTSFLARKSVERGLFFSMRGPRIGT